MVSPPTLAIIIIFITTGDKDDGKGDDGDDDEDDGQRKEGLIESLLSPVNDFPRGLSTFLKGL